MAGKRREPPPALQRLAAPLPRHNLLALQPTGDGAVPPGIGRISPARLSDLWLEHQPRELVPEEQLSYTNISRIYQRAGDVPKAEEWAAKARVLDWKRQLKEGEPPPE